MDDLAHNLLAALKKPSSQIDLKLNLFNSLKSNIKHQRIPESAQATTVECVRVAISSQTSSTLVTTGFSTLSHLIKRLTLQDQLNVIFSPRINILGALIDRLGDGKENYRVAATQCLCDLWPARPGDVEKTIREGAILSSNVRAKEAGMQWVVKMHAEQSLQFKSFVPPLVESLDHADGHLRERAKSSLIQLFRDSPDRAKADLKRQLIAKGVRKSIASHILSQLDMSVPAELSSSSSLSSAQAQSSLRPETPHQEPVVDPEPVLPPSQEASHIEPLYFTSQRDLEDTFRTMQPHFEGRESEANWMPRDNSILKLRRYLKGNAATDYYTPFTNNIRQMLDGILKVANSLRTTMSSNGCHLVQDLARILGAGVDTMVELLMQNMMKLCSATKNIAAQNGNATIDILLSHVSYNVRLVQHVWNAVQDKNVQPRQFAAGWLKTLMRRQTHNRGQFEHSGGLELVEKCIKKGLSDANPKVRETMRGAFWAFAQIWSDKGDMIMGTLDSKSRQLLEKDHANPNASQSAFTTSVGPNSSSNPRAAASSARSTLKDTIAAQKKAALAAKRMPDRPNSAMANLSPAKQAGPAHNRSPALGGGGATRGHPSNSVQSSSSRPTNSSSVTTNHGSLMSGPVRRPKKPDVPRPATADPYANRRLLREASPPSQRSERSPLRSVSKTSTVSSTGNPKKSGPSSSARPGTSGTDKSSQVASPRISPAKQRPRTYHGGDAAVALSPKTKVGEKPTTPSSLEENIARLAPDSKTSARSQDIRGEASSPVNSSVPSMVEEDNLTLVMPPKLARMAPDAEQGNAAIPDQHLQASPPKYHPKTSAEYSPDKHSRSPDPHEVNQDASQINMDVHEDASAYDGASHDEHEPPQAILRELPINEQIQQPSAPSIQHERFGEDSHEDIRSVSPTKKGIAMTIDGVGQDRVEVMKNRRILSSGIERLRAKTLDAHGFRRLQDLVRIPAHDSAIQMSELLLALVGYLEARPESLKVNSAKAISLKSQALTTLRSVASHHKQSMEIRQNFSHAICATLIAREIVEISPHFATDLERTAHEIIRNAEDQLVDCLDGVLDFVSRESASGAIEQHRMATMALSLLGKLQVALRNRSIQLNSVQKQQLGKLAVRFLDDKDPDVRRADTELCLEMFGHFGEEHKEEFWSLLKGAREAQLNLVAYYLARRVQGAR